MTSIDLSKAIFDKIEDLGLEEAAKFFGRTVPTLKKWQGGTTPPDVTAAQKVLDEIITEGRMSLPVFEKPVQQGATRPPEAATLHPEPKKKEEIAQVEQPPSSPEVIAARSKRFHILTPTNRDMSYAVVLGLLGNWKGGVDPELRKLLPNMDFENDTLIHRARNILATRFLAKGNEWSFWLDSDVIPPMGNPNWFKVRVGTKHDPNHFAFTALERLTSRNKSLIGGVYAERNITGRILVQPGISPKNDGDRVIAESIKQEGPKDEVIQVGWLGFGCVAVHRKVFEDIIAKQPERVNPKREGEPYNFFNAVDGGAQGEDVAFCQLAAECGHPSYLDLSVHCAHIGKFAFMP